jgi:NhaA family Na+:H+ antiporter
MAKESHPEDVPDIIPAEPIDRIVKPIAKFIHVQTAGGAVLIAATIVALILANSPLADSYLAFWETHVGLSFGSFEFNHSLKHLINDGLMVIFLIVIGLEVKREFVLGDLRDRRKAALPIAAALGGMVVPAVLYLVISAGGEAQRGWGIPMATDIAFVVGCMAILGKRIPSSLRVMLLTLAIADDIGAILVIAIGYSSDLNFGWLAVGGLGIGAVSLLARWGVRHFSPYVVLGVLIWYGFHESGVHATIAGVILGLMTPARNYIAPELFANTFERAGEILTGQEWELAEHRADSVRSFQWAARETISPLEYLEAALHPWVAFVIMPLFALANAGVPFQLSALQSTTAMAVAVGLVIGKPVGIFIASWLAVAVGIAKAPDCGWKLVFAGGCLAGIGFTMSLFVAELALEGEVLTTAKIGVLMGSAIAAAIGMVLIILMQPTQNSTTRDPNADYS